ncbi:MAG: bifunctional glycosyltransferase/class I SAM-dependent methyltransferase [Deltaproteobacteria bacterium]
MSTPLSLIIPAFEEAERLPVTLDALHRAAARLDREVELIVVDDGSTDATATVAEQYGARVVRLPENRGKGAAVSAGVRAARHPLIAFTDADCPYDLDSLGPMLAAIEAGRCDIAIGARDLPGSGVNLGYGILRRLSGQAFSFLTWLAIGLPFRDSQCGLKAFRADTARELFAMRTIEGFGFDFEILAAALAVGHRVERFPVLLTHSDDSRIQLLRDSLRMAVDLLRVRRALRRRAYDFHPDLVEEHPCPLCGAVEFEPRSAKNGFRMVECCACRLWYLNPMPTEAALAALYDDEYFSSDESLGAGYADYAERAEDFRDLFRHRLDALPADVGKGRILDIGAGFGYLLDAARDRFAETWAVERNATAAAAIEATGQVVHGSFAEVELPEATFDVVSMQDCFEHLRDPHAVLARVRRILVPGGTLMVVTPNTASLLASLQRSGWVSLKFPEHVALYNPATLRRILEAEGFVIDSMVPAGQYARLDFLASRIFSGYPQLAGRARRLVARLGGARRRLWVGSGSLLVMARVRRGV